MADADRARRASRPPRSTCTPRTRRSSTTTRRGRISACTRTRGAVAAPRSSPSASATPACSAWRASTGAPPRSPTSSCVRRPARVRRPEPAHLSRRAEGARRAPRRRGSVSHRAALSITVRETGLDMSRCAAVRAGRRRARPDGPPGLFGDRRPSRTRTTYGSTPSSRPCAPTPASARQQRARLAGHDRPSPIDRSPAPPASSDTDRPGSRARRPEP